MKISALHYTLAWILVAAPQLSGMQAPQSLSDAQAITSAKQLIRSSHFKTDPAQKQQLLEQAAKLFEPVYKNKSADPQLRFDARTHLEGIYAKYPQLKVPRITKIMAQEDKKIKILPEQPMVKIAEANMQVESEEQDIFSSRKKRKNFSRKIFGQELAEQDMLKRADEQQKAAENQKKKIEKEKAEKKKKEILESDPNQIILDACDKFYRKKQYRECAENCWLLLKPTVPKNIQKQAKNLLTILHEQKKDRDAAYYLALLEKNNPKKMIDLFLEAENRRDVLKEQKEYAHMALETGHIQMLNQQPNDQEVVTATSDAMASAVYELIHLDKAKYPKAFHALAAYYSHQAAVFPAMQVSLLQKSAQYGESALSEPMPVGGYDYYQILNNLGLAITQQATQEYNQAIKEYNQAIQKSNQATQKYNKEKISSALAHKYDQAIEYFKKASLKGYNYGTFNMAVVQMQQFSVAKEKNKLCPAIATYTMALHEDAPEAQRHIEKLLLEGIEEIPLNIPHRQALFNALKASGKSSQLLTHNDFKNSAYYTASLVNNKPGNLQFYEGLYWFDHGDIKKATDLLLPLRAKHTAASCFLIDMEMHDSSPDASLRAIKLFLSMQHNLDFHEKVILNESAKNALNRMATQKNIHAIYCSLDAYLTGKLELSSATSNTVSNLLDAGEAILETGQSTQMRAKFLEKSFLDQLVFFAKQNQSPKILYKAISLALNRLEKQLPTSESYELKRIILTIAMLFNHELQLTNKNYVPCNDSAHELSQCIKKHMHQKPEQNYFDTLRALLLILEGKPQLLSALDSMQTPQDALIYYLKKEAARQSLFAQVALKSGQNQQATDELRSIIKLFRHKDTHGLYPMLECKTNLFDEVARHLTKKKAMTPQEIYYEMSYKMLLKADAALTDKNFNLDESLNALCVEYPILGATMAAQELAADALFQRDLAKARQYLDRAKAETRLSGNTVEDSQYIQEVEETLKNAAHA